MMDKKMKDAIFKELLSKLERSELSEYVVPIAYQILHGSDTDWFDAGKFLEKDKFIATDKILHEPRRHYEEVLRDLTEMMITGDYSYYKDANKNNNNLSELAVKLLEIDENDIVLDLGCGEGAFLKCASDLSPDNVKLIGCDIDKQRTIIAKLAMRVLGVEAEFLTGNYLEKKLPKFTKGHVFPPFALKQVGELKEMDSCIPGCDGFTKRNSYEWRFADRLIGALKDGGKAVAVLPEKSLYYHYDKDYRKFLVSKGYVEGVIELPRNATNGTGIKVVMVLFSRNNTQIRFVNADNPDLYDKKGGYDSVDLRISEILDKYYGEDDGVVKITKSINDVENDDSETLLPSTLMAERAEIKNGIALEKVGDVLAGTQYTVAKFIQKKMLTTVDDPEREGRILTSEDITDGRIDISKLDKYVKNTGNFRYNNSVHKGDIVVTSKSSKVKVAIIEEEPDDVLIVTGGMLIIKPYLNLVDPRYIKLFLDSEDGEKELKYIQKGTSITSINKDSLKKLEIPYLDICQQHELGDKMDLINAEIKQKNQEIEELKEKLHGLLEEQ